MPLRNHATEMALEPGSTVKPIVGLGAITQGVLRADEGIFCSGYLVIDGRRQQFGRCWTASRFAARGIDVADHAFGNDAHAKGTPLTVTDAIQRSCNVFFETVGDRLKLEGLRYWYDQFGLGRPVGIGIGEISGRIPTMGNIDAPALRSTVWFSSIGQTQVLATPLQMANVAATVARDGIWVRPRLVAGTNQMGHPTRKFSSMEGPDHVDLHISHDGLVAVKEGMFRVCNRESGTAAAIGRKDVQVCGKSGTAQASRLSRIVLDENSKPLHDAQGKIVREYPQISYYDDPNPQMVWYRASGLSMKELSHAWFIGFAPREKPTVAFSVVLEYGGSGGHDAQPVAKAMLDALIEHGYLAREK
jgi:penicillin-binding protein 2